ncbi:HTH-type transcriptional regulator CdhR [Paraburkholderia sediminicola]|uniref:HTH-type transcriptional regulator CdhR n=1 Tax=Paraburkholderia sediminicola TaxID=458836 RepID=A0A6J5CXH8_9BURK|nr:HTH-type transcriptional regulator CdhR [Paraburkholderia sediminicola]
MESVAGESSASDGTSLEHFGFLMLPGFSMIAFFYALEVLRMANEVGGADHYRWSIYSLDGAPVVASGEIPVLPTQRLYPGHLPDVLLFCGGNRIPDVVDSEVRLTIQMLAELGVPLGGISLGAHALLSTGQLDGYRCSVDWKHRAAFHEMFPRARFVDDRFAIDRDRLTCTGGTASLDLMLNLIGARLGQQLATKVSQALALQRLGGTAR